MGHVALMIKCPPEVRQRWKVACAMDNLSYADMITDLLDYREAVLKRAAAQQAHPFHRPQVPLSGYPGGRSAVGLAHTPTAHGGNSHA